MKVYSIRHSCCEEPHIVGVYDSFEAMLNQLQILSNEHDHDGERWSIECHDVETKEITADRLERVKLNRNLYNS